MRDNMPTRLTTGSFFRVVPGHVDSDWPEAVLGSSPLQPSKLYLLGSNMGSSTHAYGKQAGAEKAAVVGESVCCQNVAESIGKGYQCRYQ